MASKALIIRQPRVSNDTPSWWALTAVAPIVRFNAFEILATPVLFFASDFNSRTSDEVQARRTMFFFLAISVPFCEPGFYHTKTIYQFKQYSRFLAGCPQRPSAGLAPVQQRRLCRGAGRSEARAAGHVGRYVQRAMELSGLQTVRWKARRLFG
jgi:hypothetical protein